MVRFNSLIAYSLIAGLGLAVPTTAISQSGNEMTAEQITEAFKKQKTRGLVIVPSAQQSGSTASTSVTPATPAAYTAVEREDQVNVQISFDFDSATLRNDQKPKLATLCQVMQSSDIGSFRIIGHTDASGSANYNERLSLLRAQEVKRHLETDCGIEPARLQAVGVGEGFLLDKADPDGLVHSVAVAEIASIIGKAGGVGKTGQSELWLAGLLHDIGKLEVPSKVLLKPAPLSRPEQ